MTHEAKKKRAAEAALSYVEEGSIIGVGTGSTVHYFIEALASRKHLIEGAIASSLDTEKKLKALGIPVLDLNAAPIVNLYVDGADEVTPSKKMIKGGGGALTREKIIATVAKQFICIVDESKYTDLLGNFPVAVEVIPMARSYVAREIAGRLHADPVYREGKLTDNGNVILDVHGLPLQDAALMETTLKNIVGVVESGIFAKRMADILLIGTDEKVTKQ